MIKEIKTAKAYIRCAESEATSNNLCPHLQPNKEYKAMDDNYFSHFAVKNTQLVERDKYDDEGNITTEQNLLTALELLAHPDKTVRMTLLDNESLYDNYDLSQFVVQILSQDSDADVAKRVRKAYEKLQCKDRY